MSSDEPSSKPAPTKLTATESMKEQIEHMIHNGIEVRDTVSVLGVN
ncbi:hypothetical protein ACFS25_28585 [Spirosoma flavum]|uniref:Uncharacterized protein n=1 Tax=Spirosoma flavum TaxID=2048557 RepID=A0ABW6ATL1_9BACT